MSSVVMVPHTKYVTSLSSIEDQAARTSFKQSFIDQVNLIDPKCYLRKALFGFYGFIHESGCSVFITPLSTVSNDAEVVHLWNSTAERIASTSGKDFEWDSIPAIQLNARKASISAEGWMDKSLSQSIHLLEAPHACWFILENIKNGNHFWLTDGEGGYRCLA
jgi:hypothetical protein